LREALTAVIEGAECSVAGLEAAYKAYAEANGRKAGELIHPTRLAISGIPFGPGLYELMDALGKDVVLRRMRTAVQRIRAGL
jgi:glutamyl-tRNA synthetase